MSLRYNTDSILRNHLSVSSRAKFRLRRLGVVVSFMIVWGTRLSDFKIYLKYFEFYINDIVLKTFENSSSDNKLYGNAENLLLKTTGRKWKCNDVIVKIHTAKMVSDWRAICKFSLASYLQIIISHQVNSLCIQVFMFQSVYQYMNRQSKSLFTTHMYFLF